MLSHHRDLLAASAIDPTVADAAGVRSVTSRDELPESLRWAPVPGLLFPWHPLDGAVVAQYRPDVPTTDDTGRARKYLFPTGAGSVITVHPTMRDRVGSARVVIVEGTKQYLAAVSAAPPDVLMVGIAGCWGWSRDGVAVPELARLVPAGAAVSVVFDADLSTNRRVWDAGQRLSETLLIAGAAAVRWVQLPAGDKAGLDDVLARFPDRSASFARLLERAADKLPRKPKADPADTPAPTDGPGWFFDADGLRAATLRAAVRELLHLALDQAGRIVVYADGVYVDGRRAVTHAVAELLGDAYRQMHLRSLLEPLEAELAADGRVIPEWSGSRLVNVANGLLDPWTGELTPHTPDHLSLVQFPIRWDPRATCPTFDAWLAEVTAGRGDDLLEALAQLLDMRGARQRKAVILHGPTRSGKSTLVRLVERLAGRSGCSAVTLHELAADRFAAADLYGKVLNTANEMSAAHIDDLSMFKQLTGDDPVRAQFKYGAAFTFHCRALFIFAANELPTVGEVSGAYLARVRPYVFPHSFEGREDPTLEARLTAELPGVLVRLVEALRRFDARDGYNNDQAATEALAAFARRSDRVRLFLHETCEADPQGFVTRPALFDAFEQWARENRRQTLGRHRFFESVEIAGHRSAKRRGDRGFVGLTLRPSSEWGAAADNDAAGGAEGAEHPYPRFTSGSIRSNGESESETLMGEGLAKPAPSAPTAERERFEL